jgi:hypothetical protein
MRPRPHNVSTLAFVSSPGMLCFAQVVPGSPSTSGSSPQAGGPPALTGGFGWLPITGAMSRARSGVGWERGGPRLAPPAGAVRLTAKAGLPTPLVDPGNRTVLSVQKPWSDGCASTEAGGQDPREEYWLPRGLCSDLPCRGRGPGQAVKGGAGHARRLLPPLTAGIGAPVGTAMVGASSMAGQAGRLHLPNPP